MLLINWIVVQLNIVTSNSNNWMTWKSTISLQTTRVIIHKDSKSRASMFVSFSLIFFGAWMSKRASDAIAYLYQQFVLLSWPPCDGYNRLTNSVITNQNHDKLNDIDLLIKAPKISLLKFMTFLKNWSISLGIWFGRNSQPSKVNWSITKKIY